MIDFAKCFEILTENPPFAWQIKLYERFLADEIPASCDIPTGLGKTSVIVIWLLALAEKLIENPQESKVPRRLVYVVDRRVIVDQATDEAQKILCKLKEFENSDNEDLSNIFTALQNSSFFAERKKDDKEIDVVALSTLRGEYADNREWCLDPSRPAIIVGTIDMIGSRLLFSAYGGVGESYKALQAGLLGQDSLIVIDEAHLSPAFMEMLRPLKNLVNRKNTIKRFEIMSLSATPLIDEESEPFTLEKDAPEDLTNPIAESRLNADKFIEWKSFPVAEDILKSKKSVELLRAEQAKEMAIAAAKYKDSMASVLVFGATVDLVKETAKELIKAHAVEESQIKVMVGGMRGFERDELVNDEVFKQFDPKRDRENQHKSYFLIATSCAEVGVNLDADFAVCDITSADSFIQRLGRVNRFGNNSAVVTVVHPENPEKLEKVSAEAKATFQELQQHENLNASPLELRRIKFDEKTCYPPKPVSPPLDKAKIDDWSMTSLKQDEFRRPLVSYWLRGVTENTSTETSLCWRADFKHIVEAAKFTENENTEKEKKKNESVEKKLRRDLIASVKTVRVKSRECARETTGRAKNAIISIAEGVSNQHQRVVIISPANEYEVCFLHELKDDPDLYKKLMFSTVIFPCEVGGLNKDGIADDSTENTFVKDVVEILGKKFICESEKEIAEKELTETKPEWLRVILTKIDDSVSVECLTQKENPFEEESYPSFKSAVNAICKAENRKCVRTIDLTSATENDEEETRQKTQIAYLIAKKSPETVLPNAADDDRNDDEDEASSIGYEKGETSVELHNGHVAKFAKELSEKLNLDHDFVEALEFAGASHDKGKARECWQKAVGNFSFPDKVLAKSNQNWFGHKYNNFYRHEFGSLIEAEEDEEIKNHSRCDLILHLIASHHGYARPHFPERAFDRENPKGANFEVAERAMLRFANLQIEYGWWQLAYLEAILKAADALASSAEARGEKI